MVVVRRDHDEWAVHLPSRIPSWLRPWSVSRDFSGMNGQNYRKEKELSFKNLHKVICLKVNNLMNQLIN